MRLDTLRSTGTQGEAAAIAAAAERPIGAVIGSGRPSLDASRRYAITI
jgi:hypothetical protein